MGGFVVFINFFKDNMALVLLGKFCAADVADVLLGLGGRDVLLVELKKIFHEQDGGSDIPEADD